MIHIIVYMAFKKRLERDTRLMRDAGLAPVIQTEDIEDLNLFNLELRGFAARVTVSAENGDVHTFLLYPDFPFKAPIHLINGILDRSFISMPGRGGSNYTNLPHGIVPSSWSPALKLSWMLYHPRLSVKKLSGITAEDIGSSRYIIINIGYCNTANSSCPGYPHRYMSEENDANDLHILIDPRDLPCLITQSIDKQGIKGRVIHSKLLPLGEEESDSKFYRAHYAEPESSTDKEWFIALMKEHGDRVIITDSMYFYGNPALTCPRWFCDVLHEHPPKSYVGYDCDKEVIVYHEKCLE